MILDDRMQNTAIEAKDVRISYKLMRTFSIQRNLLKRDAGTAEEFEAVKGVSFTEYSRKVG